jgi:hypothetical protein
MAKRQQNSANAWARRLALDLVTEVVSILVRELVYAARVWLARRFGVEPLALRT